MNDRADDQVHETASLIQVLRKIESGSNKIALVVDDDRRLVGTVTDGDIRRGIIRGIAMDGPVRAVMNETPLTASPHDDRRQVERVMRRKAIRHMPVVDDHGRVIDIIVLGKHHMVSNFDNPVVIMAGGFGTRLEPLTRFKPKPMLTVGGKPILQTIVESLVAQGFWRFYLSVHYKSRVVEDYFGNGSIWNATIHYLREPEPAGTAGALALLAGEVDLPVLMINGDVLCRLDGRRFLNFHNNGDFSMTVGVHDYKFEVPFGQVTVEKGRLTALSEKPEHTVTINAGVYLFEPDLLNSVPKGRVVHVTDLIERQLSQNRGVGAFRLDGYWRDVGDHAEFERANREYAEVFGEP